MTGYTSSGDLDAAVMINTIVGVTDPASSANANEVEVRRRSYSSGYRPHMLLQHCAFSAPVGNETNTWYDVEGSYYTPPGRPYQVHPYLTNALNQTGPWGQYRFHALDETGAKLANPEAGSNYEEDIDFILADDLTGADPTVRLYQYSLTNGADSADNGLCVDGGSYQYVDIDHDGTFQTNVDVVVNGSAPANSLYVYKHDIRYLGRVTRVGVGDYSIESDTVLAEGQSPGALGYLPSRVVGTGIDRGAYEVFVPPPPSGTIIVVR
jgi:hypothetical protein